jgi:hypothetical protein
VQHCQGNKVSGEIAELPVPLIVQMAQLKVRYPNLAVDDVASRIHVNRRPLASQDAQKILTMMSRVRISPLPMTDLTVDRPNFEWTAASWGFVRIEAFLEDDRPGWSSLATAIRKTLTTAGIDLRKFRYDPHGVE